MAVSLFLHSFECLQLQFNVIRLQAVSELVDPNDTKRKFSPYQRDYHKFRCNTHIAFLQPIETVNLNR